jgi:uncharacterized protein YjhX (UPF0386 family)
MKSILLTGSIIGSVVFALVFAITFLSVSLVESSARSFVVGRIEKEISEREVAGIKLKTVEDKLSWLKGKYGDEIEAAKHQLASGVRIKIEEILEKICNVDCLKKKGITITDTTDEYLHQKISQLSDVSEKMTELVKGKYYRIISELLSDLRIFAGVNLFLFLAIGAILAAKSSVAKNLILPASLLFVATIASIGIYIFGQNWFYTLMFSHYMGWGYLTYVGVIFGFLLDIVFNGAAITSSIVEAIGTFLKGILECFPGA